MQAKSKCGIFKPNKCLTVSIVDYTQTEPSTHKIAAKHPQWAKAMQAKFDALYRQHTDYISLMKMEIGEGDLSTRRISGLFVKIAQLAIASDMIMQIGERKFYLLPPFASIIKQTQSNFCKEQQFLANGFENPFWIRR